MKSLLLMCMVFGCSSCFTTRAETPQVVCRCEPCQGDDSGKIPQQQANGIQTTNIKVAR